MNEFDINLGTDVLSCGSGEDVLKSLSSGNDNNIFSGMVSGSKEEYSGKKRESNWVNYWNKTDIVPYDPALIKIERSGKSYSWFIFNNRELTDDEVLRIKKVGKFLGNRNYVMRYNGDSVNPYTRLLVSLDETISKAYMPWGSFNKDIKKPECKWGSEMGYRIAMHLRKGYVGLKTGIRAICASSIDSCIGKSGRDVVDFIVVWTCDGSSKFSDIKDIKLVGNLILYLKFANSVKIPVFNIATDSGVEALMEYVNK